MATNNVIPKIRDDHFRFIMGTFLVFYPVLMYRTSATFEEAVLYSFGVLLMVNYID